MRINRLTAVITVGVITAFLARPAGAQSQEEKQKAMEAYMKAGAVTADHEFLKRYVGPWDVETTWWTFPGEPPMTVRNAFDIALILGGRFLKMEFKGTMMGQPFEGLQIVGFDNLRGRYITLWIDNTSTAFFETAGTRDAATNTIAETGEWLDAATGTTSKVRTTTKWIGPDEFVYEMFMVMPDGKEFQGMRNRCTRKK